MSPVGGHRFARWAWTLYDLADTIFSFVVLSFYFGPWLTRTHGAPDSAVAVPASAAMLVVMVAAPVVGAIADRSRRMPFLIASTIVTALATALLGAGEFAGASTGTIVALAVLFFFIANVAFQLGAVVYDALLPFVATPATMGRVGAVGVAVGYGGSIMGLILGAILVTEGPDGLARGQPMLFVMTAVVFLAVALPCFFFVREPPRRAPRGTAAASLRSAWQSVRKLRHDPPMARFLAGRVLYADVANTTLLILGIYVVNEVGYSESDTEYKIILLSGIVFAIASAPFWGMLVDRRGAKAALLAVLWTWAGTLTLIALTPVLGLPQWVFFPAGALVGVCLAGTWSADRPLLVAMAPAERVGEWFGLYAMAGRFAAFVGPLLYALTVDVLLRGNAYARPAAVGTFVLMILASWLILRKLPEARRG